MDQCSQFSNLTYLESNPGALEQLLAGVPKSDVEGVDQETLMAMVQLGTYKYTIETWWAPEIFAIAIFFGVAIFFKLGLMLMVRQGALTEAKMTRHYLYARTQKTDAAGAKASDRVQVADAKAALQSSARSMLCHIMNLVMSTIALVLQLVAWRLFVLPSTPFRLSDIQCFSFAVKLLLAAYAGELLFGELNWEIYLHHLFTFLLLLVGQLSAFHTQSPKFFRMAQYLLLQATAEQTTYGGMAAYHYYKFLSIQGPHAHARQKSVLGLSVSLLWFTRFITYPQKILPVVGAFYWSGRMWTEVDDSTIGRFWLAWSTIFIGILVTLQVKFCDDMFSIAANYRYKLECLKNPAYAHDHKPPGTAGPVMTRVYGLIGKKGKKSDSETSPGSSDGPLVRRGSRSRSASRNLGNPTAPPPKERSKSFELSKSRRSSRRAEQDYDEEKAELFNSDDEPSRSYKSSRDSKSYGRVGDGALSDDSDAQTDTDEDVGDRRGPPSYRSGR